MLMRRLRELLGGDEARVLQFARHDNREPTTIVRLMSGATVDSLRATTTDDAVRLVPHEQSGMVVVQGSKRALLADWSRRGLAQVQDPTSASIVDHLDLRPGQRVLDRCAGLGTKTIQIVERIGPAGSVLAVDPNHHRIQGLQRLLDERGIGNVHVREVAFLGGECIDPYDRILVDAPCSNSGVLPRRAEARYAQDDRSLASLRQLQLDILNDTIPHLSPGGSLVYSTCSVWPEENEDLVSTFLSAHLQIRLIVQQSVLPSLDSDDPTRYHDGGYFAVLSRHD
jgi:16S rRNA (cytosine967-C5)-methyltransferase